MGAKVPANFQVKAKILALAMDIIRVFKNTELLKGCGALTLAQAQSSSSSYLELEINFLEATYRRELFLSF